MRRVFVETNFLLELAFQQEQASFCEKILQAAEQHVIRLIAPVYGLSEVFNRLRTAKQGRDELVAAIQEEIKQHQREAGADADDMETLGRLLRGVLLARTATQTERLFQVVERFTRSATMISITPEIVVAGQRAFVENSLSLHDALVLASVQQQLLNEPEQEECLFVSRDEKAFKATRLVQELRVQRCRYKQL
ncbi:PIN domain-containing protein [Hymenobacter weizhouensis]|uniref:PIN domain-containing protein n=1 Tax=Hymenobacter sp. YIM 151500-1 TaxID=2987689 RepID=UPI002226CEAE|nr:PIN domain-containing protein [Hymenobacter sp. YIM 151500-1]UYZ64148.1 PIN domain-containing protein [Hymenobacter sp. YIM 151500-1]